MKKEFVDEEQLEFQDESDDNDSIISQSHDLETSTPFHSLPNTPFEGVVEEEFSNEFSNKFLDEEIENENSENENPQTEHDQDTSLEDFISQLKKMTFIADDPKTYKKAISDDNAHLWKKTMIKHLADLNKLKIWDLMNLFSNKKAINGKWIYVTKFKKKDESQKKKNPMNNKKIPANLWSWLYENLCRYD